MVVKILIFNLFLILITFSTVLSSKTIFGNANVIDGDTIHINKNKITELNKQLSKYENLVQKLEIELESSVSTEDMEEVNIENSILKSELRQIEQKNRSFENELNELKKIIKNKDKEIEDLIYLKDSQHHG